MASTGSLISQTDYTAGALASGDTLTRAGAVATYFNASGVLTTAAANVARFSYAYNGSSWVAAGLLLEASDANSQKYSNTLSSWPTSNMSTPVSGATFDGTTTGFTVTTNTSNAAHYINYGNQSLSASVPYVFSVHAKAGSAGYMGLNCYTTVTSWISVIFNLSTGAVSQAVTVNGSNFSSPATPYSVNVGNSGWYRYFLPFQLSSAATTSCFIQVLGAGTGTLGSYGFIVWTPGSALSNYYLGAQLSANASSYIATPSTSTVTRNADSLTNTAWASDAVVYEYQNYPNGTIARNYALAGAFTPPANAWLRRVCLYSAATSGAYLSTQLTVGAACT